ncbi:hypothetical protein PTQ19_11145 [Microbacterium esteraromaticum]|uniref:hypothetical protein n=1 Tax=Microbacterium esteraromaticum TaxID=57043 RepID=UPI002368ECF6|nr:hypothetical protein [Microbacterium esteraromaticum]WDH78076.1 hypothetical protein PTQ19_11145 [Microbacterium esteraromaticum]
MNADKRPEEEADERAKEQQTDGDSGGIAASEEASKRSARWEQAVGQHWHPYVATPASQDRADEAKRSRASKPHDIPSQQPDPRG